MDKGRRPIKKVNIACNKHLFRQRQTSLPPATNISAVSDKLLCRLQQNFFKGLEIYFSGSEIYFQAFEIYFQATKKVFIHGDEKLFSRGSEFPFAQVRSCLREEEKMFPCGGKVLSA